MFFGGFFFLPPTCGPPKCSFPGVQAVQAVPPFRQVYFYFTKSEDGLDFGSGLL